MLPSISCTICHPELAKDPQRRRSQREADPSSPALREASLRAEPTGLPCAKRACERSPWACPARSEPASGAHGFLLRMTFTQEHPGRRDVRKSSGPGRLDSGDPGPDDPDVARAFAVAETHATRADLGDASQTPTRARLRRDFVGDITVAGYRVQYKKPTVPQTHAAEGQLECRLRVSGDRAATPKGSSRHGQSAGSADSLPRARLRSRCRSSSRERMITSRTI